jgi:hypothetical protein
MAFLMNRAFGARSATDQSGCRARRQWSSARWAALTAQHDGKSSKLVPVAVEDLMAGTLTGQTGFRLSTTVIPADLSVGSVVARFEGGNLQGDAGYSVVLESGTGSADNGYFRISGQSLILAAPLAAGKTRYSIRTEVRDGTARLDKVFTLSLGSAVTAPDPAQPAPQPTPTGGAFIANGDIFVMEAEAAPLSGSWKLETDKAGFTGKGYYAWRGGNQYNSPGVGTLSYPVGVDKAGTYKLAIRGRRDKDGRAVADDLENDVWVRMGSTAWTKVFQSGLWSQWLWAETFDKNHLKSPAQFDLGTGVHTLQISGRSQNYKIDRIVLYRSGVSGATAKAVDRPQSEKR